ncbi:MAG: hypothetical protein HQK76_08550 [Desulfobacterales bacterium]|nr:hypothetical protein [Desulfobacterales bacterium]
MKKVLLITMVVFFSFISISIAKDGFFDMGDVGGKDDFALIHGKWWHRPEAIKKLQLTDDEISKLDEEFLETQRKMIDLKGSIEKEALELEYLMDQKDFDENGCANQFTKLQNARTKLGTEVFGFIIKVRNTLGYERFQLLKKRFKEERGKRTKERFEKRKEK